MLISVALGLRGAISPVSYQRELWLTSTWGFYNSTGVWLWMCVCVCVYSLLSNNMAEFTLQPFPWWGKIYAHPRISLNL